MYANVLRKIAEPEPLQLAETLLRHVIDCKVESAFVYARLGDVYRLQKNEGMAVWAFRCAVEINERDAFAWKGLGVIAEQTGSYSEAADFYKRVLHIKPKWAEMHVALGRALLHLDEEGPAAEAFRSALVHDAANREAEKGLAVVQQKLADDAFVESLLVE